MMKKEQNKDTKKVSREEYLYHNTELLLKKYRDVVWSIEVATIQAQMNFESEMNCKLEEFLEMSYDAGADLSGTDIEGQMRTLERNKKMLRIIETAVQLLRRRQKDGEMYYWIIYYTYLSEKPCRAIDEIIDLVGEKTEIISWKTYYQKRKKAIETLSGILWGYTAKDCLPVISNFLKE